MNIRSNLLGLVAALVASIALPSVAGSFGDNKDKFSNGHDNGHHFGQHKCDWRCTPPSVTNVFNLTNVVTLTNVVVLNRTNYHYCDITTTNVVSITNIVESSLDIASSNYTLSSNHVYKLYVLGVDSKWTVYGVIRSKSDEVIRVIVPGFLTRRATPLWSLVDVTDRTNKVVVAPEPPIEAPDRAFVAMNHVLLRVIR